MINPKDINSKKLTKSVLGYDIKKVNELIDEIRESYELIIRENEDLKMRINMQYKQIEQYEKMEESLKDSILVAQSTSEQVIKTANEKSQNIIESAELKADLIINEARKDIESKIEEYNKVIQESLVFKTRYKTFLESQLAGLEDFYREELDDGLIKRKSKEDFKSQKDSQKDKKTESKEKINKKDEK